MTKPTLGVKHIRIVPLLSELEGMLPDGGRGFVSDFHADVLLLKTSFQILCGGKTFVGSFESAASLDLYWLCDADPNMTARHTMLLAYEAFVREMETQYKRLLSKPDGLDQFIEDCWSVSKAKREHIFI